MRALTFAVPLLALTACDSDLGFSNTPDHQVGLEGEGVMEISVDELVFSGVSVGSARSEVLRITSVGDGALRIDSVTLPEAAEGTFYLDEDAYVELSLDPERSKEVVVVCHLTEAVETEGVLRIDSNDRETPVVEVPLVCTPEAE